MPKIDVAKPFKLNLDDGTSIDFVPGEQNVKKEIADHWFVKAHLVGFEQPEPVFGSFEYAQERRKAQAEIDARFAAEEQEAAAAALAEQAARAEETKQRTQQAIAEHAKQAADALTKDDPKEAPAVVDLPLIPLAAKPEGVGSSPQPVPEQQEASGEQPAADDEKAKSE